MRSISDSEVSHTLGYTNRLVESARSDSEIESWMFFKKKALFQPCCLLTVCHAAIGLLKLEEKNLPVVLNRAISAQLATKNLLEDRN